MWSALKPSITCENNSAIMVTIIQKRIAIKYMATN